ncbi:MAG: Do family serine endopeptidase [Planctomycetota bacterium]|jgi:serine protease Do
MQRQKNYKNQRGLRITLISILVIGFLFTPYAFSQDKNSIETLRQMGTTFAEIAKKASPAVVGIRSERTVTYRNPHQSPYGQPFDPYEDDLFDFFFGPRGRQQPRSRQRPQARQTAQGSGFIISADGYILTNNHVVEGADKITVTLLDEREFEAKIIGTDSGSEVAVIKIEAEDLASLELADSDTVNVGEWVLAIGNPFGYSHSVTAGIVSAKGRQVGLADYENYLQTDAAINPGNSGGPLIDLDCKVVGINTAIVGQGGNIGIGFAIPINMAKSIYDQLVESGTVSRGFLGIRIQTLDAELAESYGLPKDTKGVLIPEVHDDSAAQKAGIKRGDIIVEFDGKAVEKDQVLMNRVASLQPGTRVKIVVLRDGKRKTVFAELDERTPTDLPGETDKAKELKETGFTVKDLTHELAERFGYEYDSGVIVTSVEPESDAAEKGITPGTLIMQVDDEQITNTSEFSKAFKAAAAEKDMVRLLIKQENIIRFVVLKLKE